MNQEWLQHPERLNADSIEELRSLIEQFPYCPIYRMLYCKALANVKHDSLNTEIERTACAIPDRTQLFLLVNDGKQEWVELLKFLEEQHKNEGENDVETDEFALIDHFLSQQHLSGTEGMDGKLPSEVEEFPLSLLDGCHLIEEENGDIVHNNPNGDNQQDNIINQFLDADRKGELMVPKGDFQMEDAPTPDPELIREKAFLTESLARLYVKQHKFEQALAIFSRLNLQYSKKSNNFADQIRYLNKIIEFEKETDLTSKSLK